MAIVASPQFVDAQEVIKEVEKKIEVTPNKAFLGVLFDPEKSADNAIVLLDVVPNSGAADAGLQTDDQLVSINGKAIENYESLKEVLGGKQIGDKLTIVYLRDGVQKTGVAEMKAKPGAEEWAKYEKKWEDEKAAHKHAEFKKEYEAKMKRGFLGIIADDEAADSEGVLLEDVVENSGAAKAGLQAGDLITKVNGTAVSKLMDMAPFLKNAAPGDKIDLTYVRDGKTVNRAAVLGKIPQKYLDEYKQKHIEKRYAMNADRGFMGTIIKIEKEQTEDAEGNLTETTKGLTDKGIIISEIVPESGAAKAGLQANDVITHVNGQSVLPPEMFMEALKGTKPGDKVNVTYLRDGKTANVSVVLGKVPAEYAKKACGSGCTASCCAKASSCDKGTYAKSGCGEKKAVNKALLGVYTETLDATLAKKYGIKKAQGAYVEKVVPNSAAEEAGLQVGDVIVKINKDDIYSHKDVASVIGKYLPGDAVKLKVKRNNKGKKMTATLKANKQKSCSSKKACSKSKAACDKSSRSGCSKSFANWPDCKVVEKIVIKQEGDVTVEEMEMKVAGENGETENMKVRIKVSEPTAEEKVMLSETLPKTAAKAANTELNVKGLSFYPNPNNGQFNLNFDTAETR